MRLEQEFIKLNENTVELLSNKGSILAEKYGKISEALVCYNNALEINPDYVNALIGKGSCLATFGETKTAILFYNEALKIDPRNVDALIGKG
ncbi:Tetratricopeptide repeat domain-containing protein (fragment) [Candidatus Nitrosotalea okcheonensis]|uniref:Tetratricopeptide repeat domain-containing protein n=1 Tax=Candidatus Nitrosotalea okcheonensis TaxID=1903276 RepID=A0A2H1FFX4_9ARCH